MSKPTNWLRRTAVAGTTTALALGGVMALSGPASARVTEDSFTVGGVKSATPPTEDLAVGPAKFTEAENDDIFVPGSTTVTLTLTGGGTFTGSSQDDARITGSAGLSFANGGRPTTTSDTVLTFTVNPGAGSTIDNATVNGLEIDIDDAGDDNGTVSLTGAVNGANFSDTDPLVNTADVDTARVGGQNRYATAANAFNLQQNTVDGGGANGDNDAVLASGQDFPDALSGSFLAGELETGTLLTKASTLPVDTRQAIIDNDVDHVYIVGGNTAVNESIATELRTTRVGDDQDSPFIQVIRLGGTDRYQTNARVNSYNQNAFPVRRDRALVAAGQTFPDALAAGALSAGSTTPLILTPGASLGSAARGQLEQFAPDTVDIAGGTSAVSANTAQQIDDVDGVNDVNRYGGDDRSGTSAKLAQLAKSTAPYSDNFADDDDDTTPMIVAVENGTSFADAVAAGPLVAAQGTPLLVTKNTNAVGEGLSDYLNSLDSNETNLEIFGLTTAFPRALADMVRGELGNNDPAPTGNTGN